MKERGSRCWAVFLPLMHTTDTLLMNSATRGQPRLPLCISPSIHLFLHPAAHLASQASFYMSSHPSISESIHLSILLAQHVSNHKAKYPISY
ncbi:hypothetical protein AMECASPLE_022804 [Ameca splendens]|uniref:Secreted protein n=1 Tax=Ameca splendens TaxID=208324 RepID=A0ABV0XGY3_9TELE